MAEFYCRECGNELTVDEHGYDECHVCAASREPGGCESCYCEEEEVSDG